MRSSMRGLIFSAIAVFLSISVVQAQFTWDPVWNDDAVTPTNGTWDNITANWTIDNGTNNTIWIPGSDAVFGSSVSNYTVAIVDSGVTVSNLTLEAGSGKVSFQTITDNFGAITVAPGGATWDTGGRELEIVGNQLNDTRVLMGSSNDTLTVIGGGTFDAGEKQQGANWVLNDATLDIAEAMTVRGNASNVGQFGTIKLVDGTTYIHEQNTGQTYQNDWELGSGIVTFDNRFTRPYVINGVVSGSGTLLVQNLGGTANDARLQLNQTNTFTGGIIVDSSANLARLSVTDDFQLGAVPASFDPDNIVLRNGGMLKLTTVTLDSNRGITLENGVGGVILNSGVSTINTPITGPGSFRVGWDGDLSGNVVILTSTSNNYEGATNPRRGKIQLGTNNVLPTTTLLTIGGSGGGCGLVMNGFDQTIGGLNTTGSNTRQVENGNANSTSTLTIDVAAGNDYNYGANFANLGDIALVKEGAGTQRLARNGSYSKTPVSLTINDGLLAQNGTAFAVPVTVNSGGTLGGTGTIVSNVVVYSGGSLAPGNPGGQNHLKIQGNLDISDMIDDDAGGLQFSFAASPGLKDSIVVTNAAGSGTIDMDGPSAFGDLEWGDFTFTDVNGVDSGTYPLLIADALLGTLHPTDRSGTVGDLGATGVLSLSNNTIYITIDGADVSPYGKWASDYGLPTGAENVDTDDDGYDNLQEFAYGGDPTNAALVGYAPATGFSDEGGTNWLTLAYGYRSDTNGGVDYTCLTADDLIIGTWTNIGITVLGTNTIDETFDTITNAIPIDGMKDFLGVFLEKQE